MAASRRPPPMEVYTDPDVDHNPTIERDIEKELYNALGPLGDATTKANVQLNPSFTTTTKAGSSPSKKHSSPLRPISSNALAEFNIPPPTQPNFNTDSPRKNGKFYSMYQQVAPPPKSSLFAEYALPYDKENVFESASFGDIAAPPFQEPDFGIKGPNKRVYNDAPNTKQSSKKQKSEVNEPVELPDPQNMPTVVDDGQKPQLSYAELIGMAILRSPSRRLTLAQIYKWISDNFVFYRNSEGGWQNSIRHNLSLNKNFIKQERPKDDPGKGNYWAIKPGEERPFLLGKKQPIRKAMNPDGSQYFGGLPMSDPVGFRAASAPAIGNFSMGPTPSRKMESKDIDSARFPDEIELSSEGTILASDPALQEDEKDSDAAAMPPPPVLMRSSPPPQDLGSSPPTMEAHRRGTPPPAPRYPSSSRSGGRKRKFAALNDSGYWSSIESSAARGAAQQLASESDIRGHRIKKGRAEAEIARIRSSSFDSPSKEHARNYCRLSTGFDSSPAHRDENPLTPAVVFKRPAKPPPSISPNTNLQDHRNAVRALLGSPAKSYSPMPANSWSPAFELHEEGLVGLTPNISPFRQDKSLWRPFDGTSNALNGADDLFNFHIYPPEDDISARGSPEKRSTRRLSLARAATSTGILADITGSAKSNNSMLAPTSYSPFSLTHSNTKAGFSKSPARLGSPLKRSHVPPTSSAPASNIDWLDIGLGEENKQTGNENSHDVANLFGVDFHSDGSEEGIDIFQDFGKIGQTSQGLPAPDRANGSPIKKVNMGPPARPSMARSNTSRW